MSRVAHRLLAVFLLLGFAQAAKAQAPGGATQHLRVDHLIRSLDVHDDLTYVETITQDATLLTRRGLAAGEREAMDFYPKSQSLDLVEAWVDQPDGTRLKVESGGIFTRPSEAAQSAPGFTDSQTTTVLFPQLHEGSRTHVVWRLTQKTPPLLGLQVTSLVPEEWALGEAVIDITAPSSVPLHWAQRGGFAVQDSTEQGRHHIHARIADQLGIEPERNSVSPSDFQPVFLATSQPDLESLGAIYYRQSQDRAVVTPRIKALAASIVGDRQGIEAARAIYNWVALNIRYVAVYLDENDGWVPHPAEEVLAHGYGDCKDHVVIMQALLAASGITAQPALIDWGRRFTDLPLWVSQFNHAIIYLPDYDVYLNPTNPYARFEALDPTLSGKLVVIATEHGRVARTPALRPQDNVYRFQADVTLDAAGTLSGHADISMSAYTEAGFRGAVANAASPVELAERILNATPEGGLGHYTTSNPRDLTKPLAIQADWTSRRGAPRCCAPATLPIPLGLDVARPALLRPYLSRDGERHHPMMIGAKDLNWQVSLALPDKEHIAALPADVAVENQAGFYRASYARTASGVTATRRLVLNRSVYAPEDVPALEDLIYAALDDTRVALRVEPVLPN